MHFCFSLPDTWNFDSKVWYWAQHQPSYFRHNLQAMLRARSNSFVERILTMLHANLQLEHTFRHISTSLGARDFKVSTQLVVKRKLRSCAYVGIFGSKEVRRGLARRKIATSRSGSLGRSSAGVITIDGEGDRRCEKCNGGEGKKSDGSLQLGVVLVFRFCGRRAHFILF